MYESIRCVICDKFIEEEDGFYHCETCSLDQCADCGAKAESEIMKKKEKLDKRKKEIAELIARNEARKQKQK